MADIFEKLTLYFVLAGVASPGWGEADELRPLQPPAGRAPRWQRGWRGCSATTAGAAAGAEVVVCLSVCLPLSLSLSLSLPLLLWRISCLSSSAPLCCVWGCAATSQTRRGNDGVVCTLVDASGTIEPRRGKQGSAARCQQRKPGISDGTGRPATSTAARSRAAVAGVGATLARHGCWHSCRRSSECADCRRYIPSCRGLDHGLRRDGVWHGGARWRDAPDAQRPVND